MGGKNRTARASFHQLLSSDKSCVLLVHDTRTLVRKIQTRSRSVSSIFWFSSVSQHDIPLSIPKKLKIVWNILLVKYQPARREQRMHTKTTKNSAGIPGRAFPVRAPDCDRNSLIKGQVQIQESIYRQSKTTLLVTCPGSKNSQSLQCYKSCTPST